MSSDYALEAEREMWDAAAASDVPAPKQGPRTPAATSSRLYACARCGKRARPEGMIFSRFIRNHYCADVDGCSRRARRRRREEV